MSSSLRLDTSMEYEQDDFDQEQRRQRLLQKRAEMDEQRAQLDAELASLQRSSSQSSYQQQQHHHRSPIHKQSQQRRSSNVPRSMSSNGVTAMSRHLSDRNDMSQRPKALSQRSATSMGRSNSRGNPPQRANVPFTQNGAIPPPLNSDPHPQNHAVIEWATHEQPYTAYTFSNQTSQLQQTMSQRSLEQVPELHSVGENPADFILRTMGNDVSPTLSIPSSATINNHRLSTGSYNIPSTPASDSLTTATTLASDMSRQNSLCNGFESMMKFNPNNSFSADPHTDQSMYDHVASFSSSRHSRRSSDEEQSQLLVGTGASHESQFSQSFQFPSSNPFGEKMEKSQSVESTSSSSSSASSRNVKRLQDQIAAGQARPLMPKGGNEGTSMSRDSSSQAMARIESKSGSLDKVAISKPSYQRPKHDRVCCKLCDNHPDGFRGEHELRRHVDREHKEMVKKWVCVEPTDGGKHPMPIVPLSRCKACSQQKKKYGAYYNAAAHLRRAHFNPKTKGRSKSQPKVDDADKRGGKGGGDEPPMTELKKYWIKEVEERADFATEAQQEAADESEDEILDDTFEDYSQHDIPTIASNAFNPTYLANTNPTIVDYSANMTINNSEIYDMPSMSLDFSDSKQHVYMDQTLYPLPNQNISLFSSDMFQNDPMAFANTGASQGYDNLDWNLSSHC